MKAQIPLTSLAAVFPRVWRQRIDKDLTLIEMPLDWRQDDLDDVEVVVLLLEDRRFFQHCGFDLRAAIREVYKAITLRKHGGASTLDMQFVRMQTGYRDKTLRRKLYEIFLACLLQERMDKIQILRAYLSRVYLGTGISGVEAAASAVFGKRRFELGHEEAAFIAAMMVYPRPLKPNSVWRARVERRAAYGMRLYSRYAQRYRRSI